MQFLVTFVALLLGAIRLADATSGFQYSKGPVPDEFRLRDRYPDRSEVTECRPIRLRIERDSRRYRRDLVVNANPDITFDGADARVMTSRLQTQLNALAELCRRQYGLRFRVSKAWAEASDPDVDDAHSLHFEGRTVRVHALESYFSPLLKLAVQAGFDWVYYAAHDYIRLSVIPNVCDVNADIVFMLDQSGSVGRHNHQKALEFLQQTVSFFQVASNATQVGLVTFSSGATIEFGLSDHGDVHSLQQALGGIRYRGGRTTTALALILGRRMMDPARGYGARPFSEGVPRVAVLVTDGRSNVFSINDAAPALRDYAVQVFTVGIGRVKLPELLFIASDPDPLHVFLLDSFSDVAGFVDLLSFSTCDAPAIVEPGANTTSEIEEDEFRFFQSRCAAFSVTVMIEQVDLVGSCSLYASSSVQNPSPLDSRDLVVSNEDHTRRSRSLHLHLSSERLVYVSVRGVRQVNRFTVVIWDMIFPEERYDVSVVEGADDGTILLRLADLLRTSNVMFTYTITEGNSDGFFSIDGATGTLSLARSLDAPPTSQFLLQIVAQNAEHACHRGHVSVLVSVLPSRLQFPPLDEATVPEDVDVGSPVALVQVVGPRPSADSLVVYSIVAGNEGARFAINASSGEITVAAPLDFETLSVYSLTVQARNQTGGDSGLGNQTIRVRDINEAPFFTSTCAVDGSCLRALPENQPSSTLLGEALSAADPDLPSTLNGMLTYRVEPVSVPFSAGPGGELLTSAPLDREAISSFSFELIAEDKGISSLSVRTSVRVLVQDLNDNAPLFLQAPSRLPLLEGAPNGTVLTQYVADDDDVGSNAEVMYTLDSLAPVPFGLDPGTGVLRVTAVPDHEQRSEFTFTIIASNPDGLSSNVTTVIPILDANDNTPIFSQLHYTVSVAENVSEGSSLETVVATDLDSEDNGRVAYEIVSGNFENSLSIDAVTGVISVAAGSRLDREVLPSLTLSVQARDFGQPESRVATATVVITLTDVNDNPPVFSLSQFMTSVREDTRFPREVLTVSASDRDQAGTANSNVTYRITGGNEEGLFSISSGGRVCLLGPLDFEEQPLYQLELAAQDGGEPRMEGVATVLVLVEDVDELPPVVVGTATVNVSELTPARAALARVDASGLDPALVSFVITAVVVDSASGAGSGDGVFSVNASGYVVLEQALDFETAQGYTLQLLASDGTAAVTVELTVSVVDENEFPPVFSDPGVLSIAEERPESSPVGTVSTSDRDSGANAAVTYSLVADRPAASYFSLDAVTGELSTLAVLDREALGERGLFLPPLSEELLTVQARDGGIPSLSATLQLPVRLLDINDNPPLFSQNGYEASVSENLPALTSVEEVVASDRDLATNARLAYSLAGGSGGPASPPFQVNQTTGLIQTSARLNREERADYSLVVTAADGGSPPRSVSVVVVVHVVDANDNAPRFTQPSYALTLREDLVTGPLPAALVAFDDDAGVNAQVTYDLITGMPGVMTPFSIDATTGTLVLSAPLDFETQSEFEFSVVARDGGAPARTSTASVSIRVVNIDETPPTFPNPCSVIVREDVGVAFPVVQCIAVDVDDVTNAPGSIVAYDITAGNVGGAFAFRADLSGTIVTVTELDRETVDSYALTVVATDAAGLTGTAVVRVTVSDANDNSPSFINFPGVVTITTEQIEGGATQVAMLEASDADSGDNGRFHFSIASTTSGDFETGVVVVVTDFGSQRLSSNATLRVVFQTRCLLQQFSVVAESGEVGVALLCSVAVQPPELNISRGGNGLLLCPILRSPRGDTTFQWIQNGSAITAALPLAAAELAGELLLFAADFQDGGEYACRATSPVGSIQSRTALVRIHVPPVITVPPNSVAVVIGTPVTFTCSATGIPAPSYMWTREAGGGDAVVGTGPTFTIAAVQAEDVGTYTCSALSVAGVDRANASLVLFEPPDVVLGLVANFSLPDDSSSCHQFSSRQFQMAVSDITGLAAMTTEVSGSPLCSESACSPSRCGNGGQCQLDATAVGGATCSCGSGYTGQYCQEDINECDETAPCLQGGTCANRNGSFSCTCPTGFSGFRCQYKDVCTASTPCPDNLTCVTTTTNTEGFSCENVTTKEAVVVIVTDFDPGLLDEVVDTMVENGELSVPDNQRRRHVSRRQSRDNSFITECEARLLPLGEELQGGVVHVLVWVCPEAVAAPTAAEQESICPQLLQRGFVLSCVSPSGSAHLRPSTQLQPTSINVSFVLVAPPTLHPLSAAEAIAVLEASNALERLRGLGYQLTHFREASPQRTSQVAAGVVVGGVLAASLLLLLLVAALATALLVWRRRRKVKKSLTTTDNIYANQAFKEQAPKNPYVAMATHPSPTTKAKQLTFIGPPDSGRALEAFDNPLYEDVASLGGVAFREGSYCPPDTARKASSLERARSTASAIKEHVSSIKRGGGRSGNHGDCSSALLEESDYDDVIVIGPVTSGRQGSAGRDGRGCGEAASSQPVHREATARPYPPIPPKPKGRRESWRRRPEESPAPSQRPQESCDADEDIYGNAEHLRKGGAHGNAGKRWESYWKSRTLLRGVEPPAGGGAY